MTNRTRRWYRTQAASLKKAGLIDIDLRRGDFTASQKANITKLWARANRFLSDDYAFVRVPKGTDTGNRTKIKDRVIVSRDGAQRVAFDKRTGNIIKTIKQPRAIKRVREPLAAKPQDLEREFNRLKKGQSLMVRSADGSGTTPLGRVLTDLQQLIAYRARFRARFLKGDGRRPGEIDRLRAKGYSAKEAAKLARINANEVIESWYVVQYEEIKGE